MIIHRKYNCRMTLLAFKLLLDVSQFFAAQKPFWRNLIWNYSRLLHLLWVNVLTSIDIDSANLCTLGILLDKISTSNYLCTNSLIFMAVTPFNQLIILNSLSHSRIYQCFSTTNLRIDTLVKKVLEGFSSPIG